ncbi:MAG: O-antigen ligase family protein [Nitrospirae bacterium]|nr:O-antigen ligase family protein [Nitrospirota bacterium]MBF0533639.1 O-antigen ligase family protein [Nitrospirota bacterium]MBF0616710.1 O-antigen ligase family protein [Nitrospirota bacterium]
MYEFIKIRLRFSDEKTFLETFLLLYAFVSAVFFLFTPYALIPVILIPVLFLTILKPEIFLALTFLTVYIQHTALKFMFAAGDIMEYPVYLIFLFLTLISWVLKKAINKETKRQTTPLDAPLLIIFLVETLTLLWTPNLELGLHFFAMFTCNAITFYLITAIVNDEKSLRNAVITIAVSTFIIIISVVVSKYYAKRIDMTLAKGITLGFFGIEQVDKRPMGLAGGPPSSELIVMVIMVFAPIGFRYKGFKHNLFFIATLSAFYAIGIMAVRSALASAVIGITLLIYLHPNTRKKFIFNALKYIVSIGLVVVFLTPGFIDRILMGFGYTEKLWFTPTKTPASTEFLSSSTQGVAGVNTRWLIWKSGFKHFMENPYTVLIGIGMSGFVYISKYTATETHGLVLSFLFDMGLAGIVLFLYLLWKIVYSMKEIYKRMDGSLTADIALGSVVSVIAVLGINETVWGDLTSVSSRYSWFVLSFLAASYNVLKNKHVAQTVN